MKSTCRLAAKAAILALAGLPVPASAHQPLITDDTGTQGGAVNQLEVSFGEDSAKTAAGNTKRSRALPVVFTRGLTNTLDVYAGLSYANVRSGVPGVDASGESNPSFGAKWRFYQNERSSTSFALKPEVLVPLSARGEAAGLGRGRTSGGLTFIVTQEVPFGVIHLNAGVSRDRYRNVSNNPDATTTLASIAPVWDITRQWKLALDLGTEFAGAGGAGLRSNFLLLGAIFSPAKDLDFALGIRRVSDNGSPVTVTRAAITGVTWRFQ